MAGTIYDALVNIDVRDNDTPGQMARIVQALEREIASLSSIPEVNLGSKLVGSLGEGVTLVGRGVQRLQGTVTELGTEMARLNAIEPKLRSGQTQFAIEELTRLQTAARQTLGVMERLRDVQGPRFRLPLTPEQQNMRETPPAQRLEILQAQNRQAIMEADFAALREEEERRSKQRGRGVIPQRQQADDFMMSEEEWDSLPEREKRKQAGTTKGREFVVQEQIIADMREAGASWREIQVALQAESRAANSRVIDENDYPQTPKGQAQLERDRFGAAASIVGTEVADEKVSEAKQKLADATTAEANRVTEQLALVDDGASPKVQRAQLAVATASAELETLQSTYRGLDQQSKITAAKVKLRVTEDALEQVKRRELAEAERNARPSGFFPSLFGTSGGRGGGGFGAPGGGGGGGGMFGNLIDEAGFAAKYYVLYRGFSLIEQTIQGVKETTEQYTLAVNDLSIALGTNYGEASKVADAYSDIGLRGGTSPVIAVQQGARYARTFREEDGSGSVASGKIGAEVSRYINLLEGPAKLDSTNESLIAISKAYDLGAQGARNVYDTATRTGQVYGYGTGGPVLGGVAQIADLGATQGFTMPQLIQLVAASMQSTGLTSEAVAGDIKRFLGADPKDVDNTLAALGGNVQQDLAGKLVQLASLLQKQPEAERKDILAGLGGSRSASTVVPFLEALLDTGRVEELAKTLPGASERAERQLSTLGGAFQQLSADAQGLYKALSGSGLGDVFGLGVRGLHDVLVGVTALIDLFGKLPGPMEQVAGAILTVAAASAVAARTRGVENIAGIGGLFPTAARVGSAGSRSGIAAATKELSAARVASGLAQGADVAAATARVKAAEAALQSASVGATSSLRAVTTGVTALARTLGPLALALGAVTIASELYQQYQKDKEVREKGDDQFNAILGSGQREGGYTKDELTAYLQDAQDRQKYLEKRRDNPSMLEKGVRAIPVAGSYISYGIDKNRDANATDLDVVNKEVKYLQEQMAALKLEDSRPDAIFGNSYRDISGGVSRLLDSGVGPTEEINQIKELLTKGGSDPLLDLAPLLQPASGEKGVRDLYEDAAKRIGDLSDPMEQLKGYAELQKQIARLYQKTETSGTAAQVDAASSLLGDVNKQYNGALVDVTNKKIESLKAFGGNTAGTIDKIKEALKSALGPILASGDVSSASALLATVDKAFINSYRALLRVQQKALRDKIASIRAASAEARAIVASAADLRAEDALSPGNNIQGRRSTPEAVAEAEAKRREAEAQMADLDKVDKMLGTFEKALTITGPSGSAFKFDKPPKPEGPTRRGHRNRTFAVPGDSRGPAVRCPDRPPCRPVPAEDGRRQAAVLRSREGSQRGRLCAG